MISRMGGKVISATTDGFITDIKDLERGMLGKYEGDGLFLEFRRLRYLLSKDDVGLELKHQGVGVIT